MKIRRLPLKRRWFPRVGPRASVEDTVNFVTDPLEKKLQEVPYLDYLESYSRPGESVILSICVIIRRRRK